jgi:hypothetical protein
MRAKPRKRSIYNRADCLVALEAFSRLVQRFGETSDPSMFRDGENTLPTGKINVQFQVEGNYGVAGDLFEAIRVLAGHKLPRKGRRPAATVTESR